MKLHSRSHLSTILFLGCLVFTVTSLPLAQAASIPLIQQPLIPMSAAPGTAGLTLTVNGAAFASGSVVDWNGSPLVTTFVSNTQLTAQVPASLMTTASTASVTVTNSGNKVSNVLFFQVSSPAAKVALLRTDYSAGEAYFVRAADFNSDGKLDLVVAGYQLGTVSLFLNKGNGTFQLPITITGFNNIWSLAVADVNSDGKADLVIANRDTNMVSILIGNGNGTFQARKDFACGGSPNWVTAADLNGDGNVDLAVADGADQAVEVLMGDGAGNFTSPVSYTISGAYSVVAGDFNRDGAIDLAVTNAGSPGNVAVLLNNGDGTFTVNANYPTFYEPLEITFADVDKDGLGDLVLTTQTTLTVLIGNGDGTFKTQRSYTSAYKQISPALVLGDFNADNNLDVAVANTGSGGPSALTIFPGAGTGAFFTHQNFFISKAPGPNSATTGDFNGDGKLDLAVASLTDSTLSVFLQP